MTKIQKDIIIFDLDGTLTVSKQNLSYDMAELLKKLTRDYLVAVISGGFFEQYQKQFLSNLKATNEELNRLILLPTSGTTMYKFINNSWQEIYCHEIPKEERARIISILEDTINHFNLKPKKQWGDLIEDRKTQITYSGLGQEASPELKKEWDPTREKRTSIVNYIENKIGNYSIGIGGMTSIDITNVGIDKAYGIKKIEEYFDIPIERMVFVGDALQEGGNDAPARTTGVDCVEVSGPEDTKKYIESILG